MVYLLVSVVLFNLVAYVVPKRITKIEMYTTSLFGVLFAVIADTYLDVKYQLYWYFSKEVDWATLIVLFGTYPAVNIIFLNFLPLKSHLFKKFLYIALWSVFLTIYEWGAVNIGEFLHYRKWSIAYSALAYPIILIILYRNFIFVRKLAKFSK